MMYQTLPSDNLAVKGYCCLNIFIPIFILSLIRNINSTDPVFSYVVECSVIKQYNYFIRNHKFTSLRFAAFLHYIGIM
jgi:hypothetical protein